MCRRETKCEFCSQELPSWRETLTPPTGLNLQAACMNVNFFNKVYSFKVMPGPQVRAAGVVDTNMGSQRCPASSC